MPSLEELRKEIDRIDAEVVRLLNERARQVIEIGKLKSNSRTAFFSPEREKQIFARLSAQNNGPMPKAAIEAVYREIISASRALEKPLTIAFFGMQATFTHLAARTVFGSSCHYLPLHSISGVFTEVERRRADYGVVPIENSTEGLVSHTLDMFMDSELKICSEIMTEVSHYLLSKSPLDKITKVFSHPQPFGQCRKWLENNLPTAELVEVTSTAHAAQMAASEEGTAAIASELASEIYGVPIVCARIEDSPQNFTRFFVIGPEVSTPSGKDKTSIMLSIKDRVGALYEVLEPFYRASINLTNIESRPSKKKPWEYIFFIDFHGHCKEEPVGNVLEDLSKECLFLKVLGSYPRGE